MTLETGVITDAAAMAELRAEWDELAARSSCRVSESYCWAHAGWTCVAGPRGAELRVVVARAQGRLVGVWPLARDRMRGWAMLRPLGSDSSENADMLVEPGAAALEVGLALWDTATQQGDVLHVTHVRDSCLLDIVLRRCAALSARDSADIRWTDFGTTPDFDRYMASLSSDRRLSVGRMRRRLERDGHVTDSLIEDPLERAASVDWIIDRKKTWLVERRLHSDWVGTPGYRAFLRQMALDPAGCELLQIHALRLDDKVVAMALSLVFGRHHDYYMVGHDPAFDHCSPGTVLMKECIRAAVAAGRNFDFRIGDQAYKKSWSNRTCGATTWHVALSVRGLPVVGWNAGRLAHRRLRSRYRLGRAWVITNVIKPLIMTAGLRGTRS